MPPQKKIILGITGEKGGGKEAFARFLKQCVEQDHVTHATFAHHMFSDVLNETLHIWNMPNAREYQQQFMGVMTEVFGADALGKAVHKRIIEDKAHLVVADGIRRASEEKIIRSIPHSLIMYVTAPLEVRYERSRQRVWRAGEENKSFEQFLREERAVTEVEIKEIGSRADYVIKNAGSLRDLETQAKEFYASAIRPRWKQ
ncbi:MAG: hypothetical protein KGI50_02520 [Patescibacteria group bacterium]|nr:hypothetical protein [Patescibacteria group bacterium]MDE2437780.1 hypothetical protein [Patescibacteria group bacterium]